MNKKESRAQPHHLEASWVQNINSLSNLQNEFPEASNHQYGKTSVEGGMTEYFELCPTVKEP